MDFVRPASWNVRAELVAAGASPARISDIGSRLISDPFAVLGDASPKRIAVLGNLTVDFIAQAVALGVAQEGWAPVLHQGAFGSMAQAVMDRGSSLHEHRPEVTVLCADWRDLVTSLGPGASTEAVHEAVSRKVNVFERLWEILAETGSRVLQHLPAPPAERLRGAVERLIPASPSRQLALANTLLREAGAGRVQWIELDKLAKDIGLKRWATARSYYSARLPFDQKHLPEYLSSFRSAWRLACGRAKKVLAIDLDNTLWGGVIGDDGVEGLTLGVGSPAGEAFADWQAYILALKERGVVLAVVSKNEPHIAASGFDHPASVLKRNDFAAFECSWGDKAEGLRRVADELNLGMDAIVFADDNPAECALVRREASDVEVVELSTDPSQFIGRLDAGCWFDLESVTPEDLARSDAYQARSQALMAAQSAVDLPSFLRDLAMIGRVAEPAAADMPRLAQLEQKTNQFNLTGRRYPQAELQALAARPDTLILALWLKDRFGDHGLVSSLIAVQEDDVVRIDSWLMSCRVFSRSAEAFLMRALVEHVRARGALRILGERRPTAKNAVIADLYPRLGFVEAGPHAWARSALASPDDLETFIELAADG